MDVSNLVPKLISCIQNESAWTFCQEKLGIRISKATDEAIPSLMKFKGEGVIPHPLQDVYNCVSKTEIPVLIDPFMIEARTLKDQALVNTLFTQGCKNELDDHDDSNKTDLNYLRYHVGFPIWDREFILVEKRVNIQRPDDQGGNYWVIATKSVPSEIELPPFFTAPSPSLSSSLVRGTIHESGWILQQVKGEDGKTDPSKTHVTFSIEVELGGWIPMFLCNLINIEEPLVISKIDKFLREKRDVYEESVVKHASTLETVEW